MNNLCLKLGRRRHVHSPPPTVGGGGCGMAVTEDTPPDMLAGSMSLQLVLPDGGRAVVPVQRRTAMMDLLVTVTTAHKLSVAGHALQPYGHHGVLPYKPNTPIGALDVVAVHIVSKSQVSGQHSNKVTLKQLSQPFDITQRIQVRLPRNQLYVLRAKARTTINDILNEVCSEKNLDPNKYSLRHPKRMGEALAGAMTVAEYQHNELVLVSHREASAFSTEDIISALGRHHYSTECNSRSLSPDSSVSPPAPVPPRKKKPPAPKPPVNNKTAATNNVNNHTNNKSHRKAAEGEPSGSGHFHHSRTSSDSSGYHEPSLISGLDSSPPNSNNSSLPDSLPRRSKLTEPSSNLSRSLSNLSPSATTSSVRPAVSTSALNHAGRKKRPAPAPPPPMVTLQEEKERRRSEEDTKPGVGEESKAEEVEKSEASFTITDEDIDRIFEGATEGVVDFTSDSGHSSDTNNEHHQPNQAEPQWPQGESPTQQSAEMEEKSQSTSQNKVSETSVRNLRPVYSEPSKASSDSTNKTEDCSVNKQEEDEKIIVEEHAEEKLETQISSPSTQKIFKNEEEVKPKGQDVSFKSQRTVETRVERRAPEVIKLEEREESPIQRSHSMSNDDDGRKPSVAKGVKKSSISSRFNEEKRMRAAVMEGNNLTANRREKETADQSALDFIKNEEREFRPKNSEDVEGRSGRAAVMSELSSVIALRSTTLPRPSADRGSQETLSSLDNFQLRPYTGRTPVRRAASTLPPRTEFSISSGRAKADEDGLQSVQLLKNILSQSPPKDKTLSHSMVDLSETHPEPKSPETERISGSGLPESSTPKSQDVTERLPSELDRTPEKSEKRYIPETIPEIAVGPTKSLEKSQEQGVSQNVPLTARTPEPETSVLEKTAAEMKKPPPDPEVPKTPVKEVEEVSKSEKVERRQKQQTFADRSSCPAFAFSTWGERPRRQVSIKSDRDYVFGLKKENKEPEEQKEEEVQRRSPDKIDKKTSVYRDLDTGNTRPLRQILEDSRVPVVRAVELKAPYRDEKQILREIRGVDRLATFFEPRDADDSRTRALDLEPRERPNRGPRIVDAHFGDRTGVKTFDPDLSLSSKSIDSVDGTAERVSNGPVTSEETNSYLKSTSRTIINPDTPVDPDSVPENEVNNVKSFAKNMVNDNNSSKTELYSQVHKARVLETFSSRKPGVFQNSENHNSIENGRIDCEKRDFTEDSSRVQGTFKPASFTSKARMNSYNDNERENETSRIESTETQNFNSKYGSPKIVETKEVLERISVKTRIQEVNSSRLDGYHSRIEERKQMKESPQSEKSSRSRVSLKDTYRPDSDSSTRLPGKYKFGDAVEPVTKLKSRYTSVVGINSATPTVRIRVEPEPKEPKIRDKSLPRVKKDENLDPRDNLLNAIRSFGGVSSLRRVS